MLTQSYVSDKHDPIDPKGEKMTDDTNDPPLNFVVRGYAFDFQNARPDADPGLRLLPTLDLFDNTAGDTNRLHGIAYFHPANTILSAPSLGTNVIQLHYHESMCQPILEMLKKRTEVTCYLTRNADGVNHGGIKTRAIPKSRRVN